MLITTYRFIEGVFLKSYYGMDDLEPVDYYGRTLDQRSILKGSKSSSRNRVSGMGALKTVLTTPYKNMNENNLY